LIVLLVSSSSVLVSDIPSFFPEMSASFTSYIV
jgi:hypothetical protein